MHGLCRLEEMVVDTYRTMATRELPSLITYFKIVQAFVINAIKLLTRQ